MIEADTGSTTDLPLNTAEVVNFIPRLTMRPHHFWMRGVRAAIAGSQSPYLLAAFTHMDMNLSKNPSYAADIEGMGTSSERATYIESLTRYFASLRTLADDSFLLFDLQPDGMCEACKIGIHCTSTNYINSTNNIDNTLLSETYVINHIRKKLKNRGFRDGIDFQEVSTSHVLNDFKRKELHTPQIYTLSKEVRFNPLVVRAGALRSILNGQTYFPRL